MLPTGSIDPVDQTIQDSVKKNGLKGFIDFLFGDNEFLKDIARELSKNNAKRALDRPDISIMEVVDEISSYSVNFDGRILRLDKEPVAYVSDSFYPFKGKRGLARKVLEIIVRVKNRAGLLYDGDPILRILKEIDTVDEIDPLGDIERIRREKEYRRNRIELELLKELSKVNVEKSSSGFIPRKKISLNLGYNEFFHGVLGDYSIDEVYSAIRKLEKKLKGRNREKIKALRREFEKREGISRKKRLAIIALGALAGGAAAGYVFYEMNKQQATTEIGETSITQTQTPILKPAIYSIDLPKKIETNSVLPIDINATADKVVVQVDENGLKKNFTATLVNGLYHVDVPVKEGLYKVEKVYAFLNNDNTTKDVGLLLKAFDKPEINSVEYQHSLSPGKKASIRVSVYDTSGIAKAYGIVFSPDGEKKIVDAKKIDDNYVFSFSLEKEPSYNFTLFFLDPFNQTTTYNGSISSLDKPLINSFELRKLVDKGVVQVLVNASDTSGIAKALVEVDGKKNLTMTRLADGLYALNVTLGEKPTSFPIKTYVFDPFNQSASFSGEIKWSLHDAFVYFGVKQGFDKDIPENFFSYFHNLVARLYHNDRQLLLDPLKAFSKNSSVVKLLFNNLNKDPNVILIGKGIIFSEASKLLLDLGYLGKVKVYDPQTGNYVEEHLKPSTIQAIGNYTIAVYWGIPSLRYGKLPPLDKDALFRLGNFSQIYPETLKFNRVVLVDDRGRQLFDEGPFNVPFDIWYLARFLEKNYDSALKYPKAVEAYVKQVDKVILPLIKELTENPKFGKTMDYLDKLWEFQVSIYERGERATPLEEELLKELFDDPQVREIALRQSLLPPQTTSVIFLNTDKIFGSINDTRVPSLDVFFNNVEKIEAYHNYIWKLLNYKPKDIEDFRDFVRYTLGIPHPAEETLPDFLYALFKKPDPLKWFIMSWNRFTTDIYLRVPRTITDSSKYKEVILNEGQEIPWFKIKIVGNETLKPEEMSRYYNGIAPMEFVDGKYITWEQVAAATTRLGMLAAVPPEENRVEAAEIIGWCIGYPMYRVSVFPAHNLAHGDTGFHLSSKVYNILKEEYGVGYLPAQITNGWTLKPYVEEFKEREWILNFLIPINFYLEGVGRYYQ